MGTGFSGTILPPTSTPSLHGASYHAADFRG
jgi:hypothetical protein